MIPLHDNIPSQRRPFVTWALIVLNVLAALLTFNAPPDLTVALSMVPARLLAGFAESNPAELATLFTSMFLHAGVMHLVGNMWFLYLFGDNVEDRLGHLGFLAFYLLAGLAGCGLQLGLDPASAIPVLGASGAISGVLGAYVLWYPNARVTTLVFLGFFIRTIGLPAVIFIGFWFLQNLFGFFVGGGGTAWGAHICGFAVGAVVGLIARFPRPPPRRHLRDVTWEEAGGWRR